MKFYLLPFMLFVILNNYSQTYNSKSVCMHFDNYSVLQNSNIDYDTLDLRRYSNIENDYIIHQLNILHSDYIFLNFIYGFENDTLSILQDGKIIDIEIISTDLTIDKIFRLNIRKKDYYGKIFCFFVNKDKYEIPIIRNFRIINIEKDIRGNLILNYNNNPMLFH